MREFFHGWRRKAGCVTLVMALMCAGMWCRSLYQADIATVEYGSSLQTFASTEGLLVWDQRQNSPIGRRKTAQFSLSVRIDLSDRIEKTRFRYLNDWSIKWRRRWWGFDFGDARQFSGIHVVFRIIPYWSLTLLMSLFSAFLMLWKPRKAK